ncbi:MAG: DUF1844 domain-containing protein [Acidobacteria bacterium]|nr:DUF1844 domain-containing protein [Acidobacteriota bacterium]
MTKEQEEQGFRVTDRRGFQQDGEPAAPAAGEGARPEQPADPAGGGAPPKPEAEAGQVIDFPSYILSYYAQGMVLMGEVPNPYTNKKEEDMDAARHMIDILTMLEEKTRGNLSAEELKLLENVLYELRMKFMAKTNRIQL